jgi:hypothetical protein
MALLEPGQSFKVRTILIGTYGTDFSLNMVQASPA